MLRVDLRGASHHSVPGEPDLPVATAALEIPATDRVVSWRVTPIEQIDLDARGRVAPAPPIERGDGLRIDAKPSAEYQSTTWVPDAPGSGMQVGSLQGHRIATTLLHPVQYLPAGGRLRLTRRFRVEVTTAPDIEPALPRFRRTDLTEAAAARALAALDLSYAPSPNVRAGRLGAFPQSAGQYPAPFNRELAYVIVTADSLVGAFQPLADWKTRQGIPAHIEPLSSVIAHYPMGVDLAEKVRMYARDCYQYSGTVWFLLGGDASVIPPRMTESSIQAGDDVPTEIYFSCLDGNWNGNGNSIFGEAFYDSTRPGDNVDLMPDVYAGRAPCATVAQVNNFVSKTLAYDQNPPGGNFLSSQLLFAEVLVPADYTPGQQILDDGTLLSEDVADSLPAYSHFARLYENDDQSEFPGSLAESYRSVLDSLNAGYNLALHVGHGFRNSMSVGSGTLINADVRGLHNGPRNSLLVSMDCTSGAIDYDCIGAAAMNNTAGGAYAFWGASRETYPLFVKNYLSEFVHTLNADSVSEIGEALALARVPFVPFAYWETLDRWTQFTFVLLGDPGLRFRTRPGKALLASSAASFTMGDAGYTVTVTAAGAPVESSYVCVYKANDDLRAGYTNSLGQVTLPFQPDSTGTFLVTATKRNCNPYLGSASVVARTAAYLYDYSGTKTILDGTTLPQNGNGNGVLDAGETVQLGVTVADNGLGSGTAISGTLSTSEPGVVIPSPTVGYGSLAAHGKSSGASSYTVTFPRSLRDGAKVAFNLHLTDAQNDVRDDYFTLPVKAPQPEHFSHTWVDSVQGATHYTLLKITIRNNGGGAFRSLQGKVRPVAAGVFIPLDSVSGYGNLASGASWIGSKEFRFQGQAQALSRFYLYLSDFYGHVDTMNFDLKAPGSVAALTSTGAQSSITLEWPAPADSNSVAGYYIYRGVGTGGPYTRVNSRITGKMDYYKDEGLAPLTMYSYYVTTVDSGGNVSAPSSLTSASTNPPYHTGFPIATGHEMPGSPVLVNFDHSADGSLEVVQASDGIYIWHPDGTELKDGDGQPVTSGVWVLRGTYYPNSVCVANLFQDHKFYVIACSQDSNQVFVWNEEGNVMPGWPRQLQPGFPFGSVAVGDIDGDGKPEIVIGCGAWVYAWHRDGTEVRDGDSNPATDGVFTVIGGGYLYSCPALADFDGDGAKEIVIGGGDARLHVLRADGSELHGWPFSAGGAITGSPAVVDLNLDGHLEVVLPSTNNNLYVLTDSGTVVPGWPVPMSLGNTSRSPSPAIADMDGDGYPDIVQSTTDGYIKVFNRNGSVLPGWSSVRYAAAYAAQAGTSESSPIVADLDGDGHLDVIQGAEDATLYGFNHDGTTLAGFPIRVSGEIRGTPAAWDLTNTGHINLVMPGWDKNLYVWDYPGVFNPARFPWPMFRHDDQHTGQYFGQNVITGVAGVAVDATAGPDGIRLRWTDPLGAPGVVTWNLYRREDAASSSQALQPQELSDVPADFAKLTASPLRPGAGGYLDSDVRGGRTYAYIVEMLVDGKRSSLQGPLVKQLPVAFLPAKLDLAQNAPNPFRGRTQLRFAVPVGPAGTPLAPTGVRLTIYDASGRVLRVLASGPRVPGSYTVAWDGRDADGRELASGVYFCRLLAGGDTRTRKILVVR